MNAQFNYFADHQSEQDDNESKFEAFVFQDDQDSTHQTQKSKRSRVASKRYKQEIQFDPLMIEEEILLEDEAARSKIIPESGWKQVVWFLKLTSFWFANSVMMACFISIVWPSQIATIVGDKKKEAYNGIIPILGAVVSLVITPVAGILSDYSTHPLGRRNVYIIAGSVICIIFVIWGGSFGKGSNVWLLMLCMAGVQFGANWAAGPYAGLMPDLVPQEKLGLASGYLGLSLALGQLVGILTAGFIVSRDNYWPVHIFVIAMYTAFVLPTILGIKEKARRAVPTRVLTLSIIIKSFYLDPKQYRDFFWVLFTRFLEAMGVYTILPFIQYFMKDVLKAPNPETWTSIMLATIVIASIPASITAGKLSDKYGRKLMVYISSGLMTLAMIILIIVSFSPSKGIILIAGIIQGIGYGSYQAVDWALALDVLPKNADIAKDMGLWHVSMVLPQVIAPLITGLMLDQIKERADINIGYSAVFATAAFWFLLATIFIYPVQKARQSQISLEELQGDEGE